MKRTKVETSDPDEAAEEWQSAFVDHLDGRIATLSLGHTHYYVYGEEGPWVLMVHGFSMNGAMFHPLAEQVAKQRSSRVLVYDYYGRGCSATPHGVPLTTDVFVNQLWELVDRVAGKEQQVTLLGFSMGGAIVTAAAADPRHAHRVKGLIPMVPPGMKRLGMDWGVKLMLIPGLGHLITATVAQRLVLHKIRSGELNRREFYNRSNRSTIMETCSRILLRSYGNPHFVWTARNTLCNCKALHDLSPWAKVVGNSASFPVDVVIAEHDMTCPPSTDNWRSCIPRCKVWSVPTGHMSLWEDYPRVSELVLAILGVQGGGKKSPQQ